MDRPSSAPPDPDGRRRAMSEVGRSETPTKWRLVSAFPSLRRESRETTANVVPSASGITSERRDSTIATEERSTISTEKRPKKRVSLFVRRRRPTKTQLDKTEEEEEEGEEEEEMEKVLDGRNGLRRVQSTLVKPVVSDRPRAREMRRYLQYAAELDDLSFEKLRRFVRPGGIRILKKEEEKGHGDGEGDDELIGEICLDDFADVDDDDFDFLEEASVEDWEGEGAMVRKPSLKLDSQKLRWIGNEKEFAKFFAEVGLDEWFEVESRKEVKEFQIGEDLKGEWKTGLEEHNQLCLLWGSKAVRRIQDIRLFEKEFRQERRRRK